MHRKIFKNNRRFLLVWFKIFTCLTGCSGIGRQQDTGNESALEEIELSEDAKSETAGQREQSGADDEDEKVSSGEICVYVCGQVKHPGVYRLDADSRICDAIRLAGGLTGKAASVSVNQAEKMQDGQQIYIPSKKEAINNNGASEKTEGVAEGGSSSGSTDAQGTSGKVNINTAGKEELMTLTGIGEARAQAIIKYREIKGRFGSKEQLKEVEGIKDGIYGKLEDQIEI